MTITHPYLCHPRTGAPLVAVGTTRSGRVIWPVLGGSQPQGEPQGGQPPAAPPAQPAPVPPAPGQPPAVWNIYTGANPTPAPPAQQPTSQATPQSGSGQGQQGDGGRGSDDGTQRSGPGMPWRELPLEDQVDYWRTQARRHEGRQLDALGLKPGELEQLRAAAAERDRLAQVAQQAGEAEQRGRAAAMAEVGGKLVDAHLRVAIGQRMTSEQVTGLLSNLDLRRFQTESGDVDAAKVSEFVATFLPASAPAAGGAPAPHDPGGTAPAGTAAAGLPATGATPALGAPGMGAPARQVPDMGQGDRQIARPSGLAAGREIAAQRFGNRARSAGQQQ
ncbi:hypothetical protein E1091_07855 [Micromonospora fluostatini]|uniref:DUF4355 domain-containing protein n=1 Tax=Micromonospora fluostatini TaxID=1629071 RepID=A0ABY2DIG9_9ACTN|nr:hypothetical protein E1091_07855 [Micromonospora fluostatini]